MPKKPKLSATTAPTKFKGRRAARSALLATTGFRSGYEKKVAESLTRRGIKFTYEPDTLEYRRTIRGAICSLCHSVKAGVIEQRARYTPDFKLENGTYVEAKGKFTSANRTRLTAFLQTRPDVKLCILFQRDNWQTKKHLKKYSDWANANACRWAVGTEIPKDWAD